MNYVQIKFFIYLREMIRTVDIGKLQGILFAPPSKSYAQRAILASSLASGESHLSNLGTCKDTEAISSALRSMGVHISEDAVSGPVSISAPASIDISESGLAARLLIPILALFPFTSCITGQGSILSRQMGFLVEPLQALGARISLNNGTLPAKVSGPLCPSDIKLDCSESSQFLSGLLFALPILDGDSKIEVLNLKSRPYIDMTLDVLSRFGIRIDCMGDKFFIPGNQHYNPVSFIVDGDWSGVSTFIAAPGCKTIRGLSPDSYQADKAILDVLHLAGIRFDWFGTDVKIYDSKPQAFQFDATDCPDLFPALAVLAARAKSGTSVIKGANRLVNKESNRLLAIRDEFSKMGVSVDISTPDLLVIPGGQTICSATVDSHNDHRMAMALASLALCASDGHTTITGAEAVNKSYRNFWNDFNSLYRYE